MFDLHLVEIDPGDSVSIGSIKCLALEVLHCIGSPPLGLRFEIDGKVLAFSGDTEWVEALVPLAENADLFICECTGFSMPVRLHLNWRTIEANLPRLKAKRLLLSHLGPDSLAHIDELRATGADVAEDGLVIDI